MPTPWCSRHPAIRSICRIGAGGGNLQAGAPRNFGLSLVFLGVGMLIVGIAFHILFMLGLRAQKHEMAETGPIHAQSIFPASYTLIVALLLLAIGIVAIVSMIFEVWLFGSIIGSHI